MRFRAYFGTAAPPIVRVDIHGPQGERIDYFFLTTGTSGSADGYHRWAYDLATGYYRLRFAALSAEGETIDLGTFRHAVYHPLDRQAEPEDVAALPATAAGNDLTVSVSGGTVTASGLPAGAYSLAVHSRSVTGEGRTVYREAYAVGTPVYRDTLFYDGTLTDPATDEPLAVNLLPVFDTRTLELYFSKSAPEGNFQLTMPRFTGERTVQVQGLGDEAIRARWSPPVMESITEQPPRTAAVVQYLDLSHRRRKIYQLYGGVETPLDGPAGTPEVRTLVPNKAYDVQDYQNFPDMLTFFGEVAGELRYRRRRGELSARLYNAPNQRYFTGTPLFIVNGRLTRDADYVAALPPANVERLAYYYDNRQLRRDFPALGAQGVVQIDLLGDDEKFPAADAANLLTVRGLQAGQAFVPASDDRPRLSPVLLYVSGRTPGGTQKWELPSTDDPGTYEVVLLVQDEGSGKVSTGRATVDLAASR